MDVSGFRFPLAVAAACALSAGCTAATPPPSGGSPSAGAPPPGAAAPPTSGAVQPKVNRLVMAQVAPPLEYNVPRNGSQPTA